ncbi:MAG: amidohydrolase family protein [Candidatus Nitrosopelagicus sp.]|nr:amidohydrolase family protein [Candidatus Nitrosopelagicus sp.]
MILKNISILYGTELKYIESTDVQIKNGNFEKISKKISSKEKSIDCSNLLLIPGFINSHTHIADSIGKDLSIDADVDSKIHPMIGLKQKLLKETPKKSLSKYMKNSAKSMIKNGITTFIDFREGGLDGVLLLKSALDNIPIRCIILGRIEHYNTKNEIKQNMSLPKEYIKQLTQLLKNCDGIGISGTNENSNSNLQSYAKTKKIRAIHAAETKDSVNTSKKLTTKSEIQRAMLLRPSFLIHMTFATKNDLKLAAKNTRGIVICPRANSSLAEGIPDISSMQKSGCNITIGTDNVMINSPDIFREMDYLWKVTMGMSKSRFDPKQILKMATVNAGKMLNQKIGCIKENYFADCLFINKNSLDLEPMNNVYASIVHRASENSINAVMIGGKIVNGKL